MLKYWTNAREGKFHRFADALARLCSEHGVCIRAPVPGQRPILCDWQGDETGYEVWPLAIPATEFTFDRAL